ncbi:5363_t:CDS:2 [Funneliformis geosporum]|uniref:2831_t:CDS:1 n=1 Tax=Funneliformis geosporum TaxID=1117311 RepID=A0A9W4SBK5_9GLOM|nr:2831_t:CDS:2 [Funneliformis geosporum]CAI2178984.1 5363_t:CDS:2 [Funneliformis geosporum]
MGNQTKRVNKKSPTYSSEIDDIPDDEKMRLINESGIKEMFEKIEPVRQEKTLEEYLDHGPTFQAFLYTIPLCSVYTVMDILVHRQYNEDVSIFPFSTRVLKIAPSSIGCGCYLIYVLNKISYYGVMRRCPPLATLWIYFVIQLNLWPSVLSLVFVYLFFRIGEFKLG